MDLLENYLKKTTSDKYNKAAIAYLAALDHISETAPEISQNILKELHDQRSHLKLIASENYSSIAVQLAMGNLLTDKYAEGYPYHRFYAGCEQVDAVEELAVEQLKKLFKCDNAYVQPHSGADANIVATWAILVNCIQNKEVEKLASGSSLDALSPEEYERIRQLMINQKIMGMSLKSGGHLTHGYRHNISSKMMRAIPYDVDLKTGLLDYSSLQQQVQREKPLILLAGYSAYPRRINFAKMREIADSVGAILMADIAHFSGLVAGKVFQGEDNPIPYAHVVTSTTHKTLRGPRGGFILCTQPFADTVNKGCPLVLGGPLPHVMAAKAIAFKEANSSQFCTYAKKIVKNAQTLAEMLQQLGLTLVTGGTDNHLILIDLSDLPITGRQAELALREAKITTNRNTIPADQEPWYTNGLRVGTAALTTRGMGPTEMKEIAHFIYNILIHTQPLPNKKMGGLSKVKFACGQNVIESIRAEVDELLKQFPLYPEIQIVST